MLLFRSVLKLITGIKRAVVSCSFHSIKLFGKLSRQLVINMDSFYCIFCTEIVTSRQEALLCDGCDRWQHRRCETGITREQYRAAVRSGEDVIWRCLYCGENSTEHSLPVAESTRVDETDNSNVPASFEDSISLNQETGMAIFVIRGDWIRVDWETKFLPFITPKCCQKVPKNWNRV